MNISINLGNITLCYKATCAPVGWPRLEAGELVVSTSVTLDRVSVINSLAARPAGLRGSIPQVGIDEVETQTAITVLQLHCCTVVQLY